MSDADMETKVLKTPYMLSPNRELSNKELTEVLKLIGVSISDEQFNRLSIPLKSQFKKSD